MSKPNVLFSLMLDYQSVIIASFGEHDMGQPPFFSIIIPLYNRADKILATIHSVLEQTDKDFEIIIVDDGSNDRPDIVIDKIDDYRVRLIRQTNAGGGSARNRGVWEAQGKYICFLDSDDFFLPKKLETVRKTISGDITEVLYSSMYVDRGVGKFWIRPSRGILKGEDVGEYLFVANQIIQTSTIVISTQLARKVLFDPSLPKGQDLDFCLRLQKEGCHFRMINEPLTIWSDITEVGRTSHVAGHESVLFWLDRCSTLLSYKANLGYRATVLAYYMGRHQPLTVARDLFLGFRSAGVPFPIIVRQALRAYLPKGYYRFIANALVKVGGRKT
jgi:glycosyltransferase involved in cell wall biosynthesis